MKKISLIATLLLIVCALISCTKEKETPETITPLSLPIIIKYDITKKYAVLENNPDTSTKIIGFDGTYSIKWMYSYKDFDNTYKSANAYAFAQSDSGRIYLQGGDSPKYVIIKSNPEMDGDHLYFKFDIGYDIFSVSPAVLTDSTKNIIITRKSTKRTMIASTTDLRSQGFLVIRYDK